MLLLREWVFGSGAVGSRDLRKKHREPQSEEFVCLV
jgi:hypothetical protein